MAIINIKGVKIVSELYPVRLIPVFKDYLWGGTKLKTVFNKKSELNILAESWELERVHRYSWKGNCRYKRSCP